MEEYIYKIGIRRKVPYLISGPEYIVTDNTDYRVEIEPDEEWDDFPAKSFIYAFDNGKTVVDPVSGNTGAMPMVPGNAGKLHFRVSAGEMHTTTWVTIPVRGSVRRKGGAEVPPPTPDQYDKIMSIVSQALNVKQPVKLYTQEYIVDIDGNNIWQIGLELSDGTKLTAVLPPLGLTLNDVVQYGMEEPMSYTEGLTKQFYVNTVTGEMWTCTDGGGFPITWRKLGRKSVLSGNVDPTTETVIGEVDQLYVNTDTGEVYICTFASNGPTWFEWEWKKICNVAPVSMGIRTITNSSGVNEYVLIMTLENGTELTTMLPVTGLTSDDVVTFGSGKPSLEIGGNSSKYKQFYVDTQTSQMYIRTNEILPGKYIAVGGFLAGDGEPSRNTVASVGNIYLNTATKTIYRCTNASYSGSGTNQSIFVTWEKIATIPTKTSELSNDSGFITKAVSDLANYYSKSQTLSKEEINALVSQIPKFSISVVDALPTSGISPTTIYLVKSGSGGDLYTEYIYTGGDWEILGSQRVDLTGYATEVWVKDYVTAEKIVELLGYTPAKAEDVSKLSEAIADLDEAKADGIIESATGEVIAVSDSAVSPLRGLTVYGKSTQDGTPTPDAPVPIVSVGGDGEITLTIEGGDGDTVQTLPIATPNGLPGIPVTSGGNYTDASGQMWVCDTVDFVRGVYTHKVWFEHLQNTAIEMYSTTYEAIYANASHKPLTIGSGAGTKGFVMSSHFVTYTGSLTSIRHATGAILPYISTKNEYFLALRFDDTVTTVEAAMEIIGENGFDVLYILAEPIETPLTEEELAAYRELLTNYPNTTIYADDNAGLAVQYKADTKAYIDKKFAELATAIVNA